MTLETWVQVAGLCGVGLGIWRATIVITAKFTTVENAVKEVRKAQITAAAGRKADLEYMLTLHKQHFDHEKIAAIHQVSMSEKTAVVHFEGIKDRMDTTADVLAQHTKDDMEVIKNIRDTLTDFGKNLQKIRERLAQIPTKQLPIPD